jgi:hypothetical protein
VRLPCHGVFSDTASRGSGIGMALHDEKFRPSGKRGEIWPLHVVLKRSFSYNRDAAFKKQSEYVEEH